MSTFIFFKELTTDTVVKAELGSLLREGESVVSASLSTPSPVTATPLGATLALDQGNAVITLTGGEDGISYGADMTIITDTGRSIGAMVAVSVHADTSLFNPYAVGEPDAFKDLVGTIGLGQSAVGTAVFSFSPDVDPSNGYVIWEIVGEGGHVYASGNCYSYDIQASGYANTVLAKAVITVPSNMVETVEQQAYQLRWTLNIGGNLTYSFENLTLVGAASVPLGTQPMVELQGPAVTLELVTDQLYDQVSIEVFANGTSLGPPSMIYDAGVPGFPRPQRVGSGFFYGAVLETKNLSPSIKPYSVVWRYSHSGYRAQTFTDRADLWIINPSVMSAVHDLLEKVNKARTTLYGKPDLLYPYHTCMTWLRRGADMFNGYKGKLTNFTFLNATGGIREYWLTLAELLAIQSQYLAEGEKAFDYQGLQVSLSVDHTQYLAAMADRLQGVIDSQLDSFKYNLIVKNVLGGDGNLDGTNATALVGAVGLTLSPASAYGMYSPSITKNIPL